MTRSAVRSRRIHAVVIPLAATYCGFQRRDTSPKRKRGRALRSSLALRVSVNSGREQYSPLDPLNRVTTNARPHHSPQTRQGLTLFEVVLALGIFLGALAAVSQLISTGSRAAVQSQLRTKAIFRCESKLAEILAGAEPMQAVDSASFEDQEPGWAWSLQVAEGPHIDLLELEVTVTHTGQNGMGNVSYSLTRYVRDPQLFLDAAVDESAESEE